MHAHTNTCRTRQGSSGEEIKVGWLPPKLVYERSEDQSRVDCPSRHHNVSARRQRCGCERVPGIRPQRQERRGQTTIKSRRQGTTSLNPVAWTASRRHYQSKYRQRLERRRCRRCKTSALRPRATGPPSPPAPPSATARRVPSAPPAKRARTRPPPAETPPGTRRCERVGEGEKEWSHQQMPAATETKQRTQRVTDSHMAQVAIQTSAVRSSPRTTATRGTAAPALAAASSIAALSASGFIPPDRNRVRGNARLWEIPRLTATAGDHSDTMALVATHPATTEGALTPAAS